MNKFTINLKNLDKSIEEYKTTKKTLLEEVDSAYENLKNADSGWNDDNSIAFIERVKKDKFDINNYFEDIDKLYSELENLKEGFNNILSKYNYTSNSAKLKFDENKISSVLTKLSNVKNYLSNALYYINLCNFDDDFSQKRRVRQLINSIKNISSDVNTIYSRINKFRRDVNNLLIDSQHAFSMKNTVSLDIDLMEYNWSLKSPQLKTVKIEDPQNVVVKDTKVVSQITDKNFDISYVESFSNKVQND